MPASTRSRRVSAWRSSWPWSWASAEGKRSATGHDAAPAAAPVLFDLQAGPPTAGDIERERAALRESEREDTAAADFARYMAGAVVAGFVVLLIQMSWGEWRGWRDAIAVRTFVWTVVVVASLPALILTTYRALMAVRKVTQGRGRAVRLSRERAIREVPASEWPQVMAWCRKYPQVAAYHRTIMRQPRPLLGGDIEAMRFWINAYEAGLAAKPERQRRRHALDEFFGSVEHETDRTR